MITRYCSGDRRRPAYGKLGDLYGRKRALGSAVGVFLVGSALSGQSPDMSELIAFRAVQGMGGGGLIIVAQSVVGDIVPPRDRGQLPGAVRGGVRRRHGRAAAGRGLVEGLSWRWIFYVNLPSGSSRSP